MHKFLTPAALGVLALAGTASATLTFTIQTVGANPTSWSLASWNPAAAQGSVQPDGTILYEGSGIQANGWELDFSIRDNAPGNSRGGFGSDFVVENLVVTNTLPGTLSVITNISSPIPGPGYTNATIAGSAIATLSDTNADGFAQMSVPAGENLYTAILDGVDNQTLGPAGTSATTSFPVTTGLGPLNFNNVAAPDVFNTLGIRTRFDLTPGDTVTYQSTLAILGQIVPTPGAAALALGAGLVGLRRRRA